MFNISKHFHQKKVVKNCQTLVQQNSKMTGGTPEVRSVKINLIDFLTFDLIDF